MAKKNPKPEETRAAICGAAASLFMENGIHATSLYDIARFAHMSKGTLYYHYPSKEALTLEIAEAHFSYITAVIYAWIEELEADTPALFALEPLAETLLKERSWVRLHFALLGEALREDGALRALLAAKQHEWAVMLEVSAIKMTGPGARLFLEHCREYIPLLYGYAMHKLSDEKEMDATLLNRLICE